MLRYLLFIIIASIVSITARSQFVWNVTHTDYDGRHFYVFETLSCYGSTCFAAGSLIDEENELVILKLWRSDDGGNTWRIQDVGIKAHQDLRAKDKFYDIQQIDSLCVVAGGVTFRDTLFAPLDSGLLIRTTDGGASWSRLAIGKYPVKQVHFADPLSGIVLIQKGIGVNSPMAIATTLDGGEYWLESSLKVQHGSLIGRDLSSCHSYGGSKFVAFQAGNGRLYTTNDNWQTHEVFSVIIEDTSDPDLKYFLSDCNFTGGDTVMVYGHYRPNPDSTQAVIFRSIDRGKHWSGPFFPGSSIRLMTTLTRDTVFATANSGSYYFISTDRGVTWSYETLKLDTTYAINYISSLAITGDGHPLAIISASNSNTPSIIVRGGQFPSKVRLSFTSGAEINVFPNPAKSIVNFTTRVPRTLRILDAIGRTVDTILPDNETSRSIDCTKFSPGLYTILIEDNGAFIGVSKFMVQH